MLRNVLLSCILVHVIAFVTSASVKANCGTHKHGDKWNHDTLACLSYRCRDGTTYPKYTGCVKDNRCYDVDQKWEKDCSKFQCVSYKHGNMTYFETKLNMQCTMNGKGGKKACKPNGAEWKEGCDFKRCDVTTGQGATGNTQYSALVINVKQGCADGKKKCYYAGDQWFKKCVWYTCKVTSLYTKAVGVPGCTHKRKCFKVGKYRSYKNKDGCYRYLCKQTGQEVGWKLVSAACNYGGKCRDSMSPWRMEASCMEKQCVSTSDKGKQQLSLQEKPYGCRDGKICRDFGSTWTDSNCSMHKCSLNYGAAYNEVLRTVCKDRKGVCKDWNSGTFEGVVQKGKKKTYFKNCTCEKDGKNGSKMTCTGVPK